MRIALTIRDSNILDVLAEVAEEAGIPLEEAAERALRYFVNHMDEKFVSDPDDLLFREPTFEEEMALLESCSFARDFEGTFASIFRSANLSVEDEQEIREGTLAILPTPQIIQ